jgi:hypothetical protein
MSGSLVHDDGEAFIAHYASQYYDPVKAREYYLRTRELKGRKKAMSEEQRSAWDYTKGRIDEERQRVTKSAADEFRATVERARQATQAAREQIANKLRDMMDAISKRQEEQSESLTKGQQLALDRLAAFQAKRTADIRKDAAQRIAALPPIPEGVSAKQRAKLAARRAEKVADINGQTMDDLSELSAQTRVDERAIVEEVSKQRKALSESGRASRDKARDEINTSRKALAEGLKATVEKARSDYNARKEQIKAEFEATMQREQDAILANVPGGSPSGSSKKGGGSSSKGGGSSKKEDKSSSSKSGGKSMSLEEAAKAANEKARLNPR